MIGLLLKHLLNPLRRRGVSYISVLNICKRQRNLCRKNVKKLPPIEEIHGLETPPPPKVVEVKSLMKFNASDDPRNKHPSQCLHEFDKYIRKQDHFNANVM